MNSIYRYISAIVIVCVFSISNRIEGRNIQVNHNQIVKNNKNQNSDNDLIFVNEKGEKISLNDLKGKVVFINFWATWCRPCVEEMASINELKKKLKNEDIVFVMLNIEANLQKAKKFMTQRKLDLPVYVAGSSVPPSLFKNVVPTTLIYNKEGHLEANLQGMMDYNDPQIFNALKQLIEK